MPKVWKPGQEKQFCREIKLGKPYYTVMKIARNMAPYEDAGLYSEYVFTSRLPITNNPCTDDGYSAETLLRLHGPIYDAPPRGMRNIADPAPQVAGPLGYGNTGELSTELDGTELRGLEKRVRSGSDPHTRQSLRGRGRRR